MSTASTISLPKVTPNAYLTLHYRLAVENGQDIVTTFQGNPATLQMGIGQLAPFLEACLLDLPEQTHQVFNLSAQQAFGERNSALLQRVSRSTLESHSAPDADWKKGDLIDFAAPGGGRFAGVFLEMDGDGALFDFNHPLAGKGLQFEVKIMSVL